MAYFYCDFRDISKQNRHDLLCSLVIQLSARSDPYYHILSSLYQMHDSGMITPSEGGLMRCLKEMVTLPDQPPVFIIIDALDECRLDISSVPTPREQVLELLTSVATAQAGVFEKSVIENRIK